MRAGSRRDSLAIVTIEGVATSSTGCQGLRIGLVTLTLPLRALHMVGRDEDGHPLADGFRQGQCFDKVVAGIGMGVSLARIDRSAEQPYAALIVGLPQHDVDGGLAAFQIVLV